MAKAKTTAKGGKKSAAKSISLDEITSLIDATRDDVTKFNNGVQAPASRIRKAAQAIIVLAKQMRKDVIEIKNSRK